MTPPARATLSFCSGCSAIHVVHLIPTTATIMEIKLSKMEVSISPRVPCTIPEDTDLAQNPLRLEQVSFTKGFDIDFQHENCEN